MQRLDTAQADFDQRLEQLTAWQESLDRQVTESVTAIVADVAGRGDPAVLEYTARFDRLEAASVGQLEVSRQRLGKALERIEHKQREALAALIHERYHLPSIVPAMREAIKL